MGYTLAGLDLVNKGLGEALGGDVERGSDKDNQSVGLARYGAIDDANVQKFEE